MYVFSVKDGHSAELMNGMRRQSRVIISNTISHFCDVNSKINYHYYLVKMKDRLTVSMVIPLMYTVHDHAWRRGDFLDFFRFFQSFFEGFRIIEKCFLGTGQPVMLPAGSNPQPHTGVLSVAKVLTNIGLISTARTFTTGKTIFSSY